MISVLRKLNIRQAPLKGTVMSRYDALLKPGYIANMSIKNRIVMAPMGSNLGDDDGYVGQRLLHHYRRRAEGGAGLLIVEGAFIDYPRGNTLPYGIALSDDRYLPGLTALVDQIHQHGAKAAVQVQHGGKSAAMDMSNGYDILVPTHPKDLPPPERDSSMAISRAEQHKMVGNLRAGSAPKFKVLEQANIDHMVKLYAEGAERAKRAGFDAVELHAAHGYLLASFLSGYSNRRTDRYGGSLENRARFMVEVITAVRAKVGEDFPVWIRMNAMEYHMPGGIEPDEAVNIAKIAERAGVDALHVSAYGNTSVAIAHTEGQVVHEVGGYLPFSSKIKAAVKLPVIAVGRIEPEKGAEVIAAGQADFITMGRKLLADPDLPNKLKQNVPEQIRPCIYCYTCVGKIYTNERLCCAVNPDVGVEQAVIASTSTQPQHILVVGGGPGGMEAARQAAQRGHRVTLCEQQERLGGTAFFASVVYPPIAQLVDYLKTAIAALPIDVRLKQSVDAALIRQLQPDKVIVAAGAKREAPVIPGVDLPNVFSGDELQRVMAGDAAVARKKLSMMQRLMMLGGRLSGVMGSASALNRLSHLWLPLGKRVAIIGGGLVGLELAEFLVARGRQVTVLEETTDWGPELAVIRRWRILHELKQHHTALIAGVKVDAIRQGWVDYQDAEHLAHSVAVDSVIVASGAQANHKLIEHLKVDNIPVVSIGDCTELNYIQGAMADAQRVVAEL